MSNGGLFKHIRRFLWALTLWMYFSVGCFLAPALAILYFFVPSSPYMERYLKAADRMCAAMLGFSGRNMLSSECAHDARYQWMRRALDEIEDNHCMESAYEEGMYCSIRDHTLRSK